MVTGGDVLVRVEGAAPGDVVVRVDDCDVTGAFHAEGDGLLGLVDGLEAGRHRLTATAGRDTARLTLTNHPLVGPLFSGPHEQPFVCETESAGLGPPLDADCSIATRSEHLYRTTSGEFAPWPAGATGYPADMARTTTTQGRTVPYVVITDAWLLDHECRESEVRSQTAGCMVVPGAPDRPARVLRRRPGGPALRPGHESRRRSL